MTKVSLKYKGPEVNSPIYYACINNNFLNYPRGLTPLELNIEAYLIARASLVVHGLARKHRLKNGELAIQKYRKELKQYQRAVRYRQRYGKHVLVRFLD